jgi:hypothetical protein
VYILGNQSLADLLYGLFIEKKNTKFNPDTRRCQDTAEFIHNPMKRYPSAWQKNVNDVVLRRLMTSLNTATGAVL